MKEKLTNWQELSNALISIVNNHFICHVNNSDWGSSVLVMERKGKAFARTYWYNDDAGTIYFDWLSVDENERKNGIATELLNAHIEVAKKFKVESFLNVQKDSWMHEWYKRKGYEDYKDNEKDSKIIFVGESENDIWMKYNSI